MNNVVETPLAAFFREHFGYRAYYAIEERKAARLHHPTAGNVLSETVAVMRPNNSTNKRTRQ